ncbi:hypothetical protein F1189_00280 [Rhodovastum atsumiense]|uniref:Uncharacterized protein n=1 Tax=Rhodovastum atsumiense TaxID=504468 RepID=A0A5M6J3B2_9PROT|nr:hypothetical protein F1189_00280 [Rhodovastum atsumiense]
MRRIGTAVVQDRGPVGGVNLPTLQVILDHKTIAMTMRSSRLATEHLHRAMNKYGTMAGGNPGTAEAASDR